jgi:heme exporter protein C
VTVSMQQERGLPPDSLTFRIVEGRGFYFLTGLSGAAFLVALWAAFSFAPTEATMGHIQRIFYFHVPAAYTAFLAFAVVAAAGAAYLRTRNLQWDVLARSSAEIGVLFTTIALISGSLWAKPVWGAWWTWDPRLTTTALLWLMYASYLLLRSAIPEPDRQAAFGAVAGIASFANVPIVFMSIRWWRSLHPAVVNPGRSSISSEMLIALGIGLVAFTLLYVCLLLLRAHVEESQRRLEEARLALGLYAWKGE